MWTFRTIIIALLVCEFGVHPVPAMVISSSKLIPCEVLPNGMIALIDQSSDDQSSPTSNNSDNQTMCNIPIYSPVIKIGMSTLDEIFTEANKEPAEGSGIDTSTAKPATACDGVMVDLDMCLTPAQDRDMADDSPRTSTEKPLVRKKRKIVKDPTGRWPHNTIPYEIIENDFTVAELRNIIDAFTEYEIHTCIIFKPATPLDTNKLVIMGGQGCYSNIGMIGGTQRLVLDKGNCRKKRVIMHELGHAIGMVHEHQRWDRDDFITILRKNVRPDVLDQFRKFSQTIVDTTKVPYDYLSIMHYGSNSRFVHQQHEEHDENYFSFMGKEDSLNPLKKTVKKEQFFSKDGISTTIKTNNVNYQDLIGRTEQLSFIDIKAVNLMYKCNARCPSANTMVCPWDGFQDKYCECRCSDGQVCQQNPELTNLFIRPSDPFLDQILMPNTGIISGQQQIMYESNPRNYPIEYPYAGHATISDLVMQPPPYSNFIYDPISLSNLVPNPPFIPSMMQRPSVSVQFGLQNHSVPTTIPTSPTVTETFTVYPTTQSQPNPQPVELNSKKKVTIPSEVKIQTNYTTGKPSIVTNLASVQILNITATKKPPTPQNESSINITAMGDVPAVANPFRKQKQAPVNQIHMEISPFSAVQPKMSVNHHGEVAPKSTRSENGPLLSDVEHRQHSLEEKAILFRKIDRQRQNSKRNYLTPPSKEEQALAKLLANEQTRKQTFPKDEQKTPQEQLKMSPLEEQLLKIRAQIIKLEDQRQQRRTQRILESKSQRNPQQLPFQVPADKAQKNSQHKKLQQSHYPLSITSQPLRNVGFLGNRGNIRNNRFRGRNHRRFENQSVLENSRRQPRIQSVAFKKQATSANGYQTIQRGSDLNTPIKRQNTFNTGAQNYRRFNNMGMNNNRNSVPYQQNVNTVQLRQTLNNQPSLGTIRRNTNNVFSAHSRNVASNGQTGSRASNVQSRNGAIFGQSLNRGFSGRNRGNFRNQLNTVNSQRMNSQRLNSVQIGGYGQNSRSNVNVVSNRHSSFNRQNPQYNIQNRGRTFQTQATRSRNIRQNKNTQRMFQNSMGIRQNSMRINQNSPPALNSFRSQQNSQSRGNSGFNRQNSMRTLLGSNRLPYNPSIAVQRGMNQNVRSNTRMASPNRFNNNDSNVTPRPAAKSAYFVSPFEDRVDSWL